MTPSMKLARELRTICEGAIRLAGAPDIALDVRQLSELLDALDRKERLIASLRAEAEAAYDFYAKKYFDSVRAGNLDRWEAARAARIALEKEFGDE